MNFRKKAITGGGTGIAYCLEVERRVSDGTTHSAIEFH